MKMMNKKIVGCMLGAMVFSQLICSPVVLAEDSKEKKTEETLNSTNTPPPYTPTESDKKEVDKTTDSETKQKQIEEQIEAQTPASVTGQKVEGTGTVTDFVTTGSKAFYTITDSEQKTFYLIIDMEKTENNVYFLSDINKSELQGTEGSQSASNSVLNKNSQTNQVSNNSQTIKQDNKTESVQKKNNPTLYILIGAVGLFLAYYFLVFKKKKQKNKPQESEEEEILITEDYDDEDIIIAEENDDTGEEEEKE